MSREGAGGAHGDGARLRDVLRRLREAYGDPSPKPRRPALDCLIATLLSQNTTDRTSERAFRRLKRRFGSWERVAAAPASEIEEAVRVAGLAPTKSVRIKEVLARLKAERGRCSLGFLRRMPTAEAMAYLCGLPGIGPKTAACTLLFSFGAPAFPVDTHIHRVARRLGIVPDGADRVRTQERLQAMAPEDAVYPLHLLMIELGRRVCRPRRPRHEECPLRPICPSAGRLF